ncbi:unnamed protein product [Clavelina lepadiformis]|uniref:Caspase family p20 domain-containing protein n=1 Tax=Clavelina lepadiformis TaxID=159417 RepID=A0ABP0G9B1_CLALP
MNPYTPLQTSTIIGDWASTVKLGGCEIKFPPGAVDKCAMVAFTLTYSDKDDDRDSEEVTVTPILTCLPDMHFKKPVIMTLPSCYNSFEDDMPVTIMTDKGKTWTELCEEKCTDNWVTFETESFSRKDEDLKLTFQCENAKVESRVMFSKEIFRKNPVILIEFKFIKNNDLDFGAVTFKVKNENIDDTIEKIKALKVEELNVLHAIRKHYDDHIGNEEIYQIRLKPKGRALILSNAKFSRRSPDGEAEAKFIAKSNEECSLMRKLFEGLGCEVNVQRNKSAEEMLEVVQRFVTRSDHSNYSILFVMTHGAKSLRIGTEEADMLIAHCTTEGFPAFRGWFTHAIVWCFSQHAKDTEIMPLLGKVRKHVSQRTSKSSSRPKLDGKKQCPRDNTGLLKDLYFFPGISPDRHDNKDSLHTTICF